MGEEIEEFESEFVEEIDETVPLVLITVSGGYSHYGAIGRVNVLEVDLDEIVGHGEDAVPPEADAWMEFFPGLEDDIFDALEEYEQSLD